MAYEVDVLAVGDESKSGDAIALRFGNFVLNPDEQKIVIIDGGFKESGEKLVKRIREDYGTNHVDLVISTHPDQDHLSGLHVVLEEMDVETLWMHQPWHKSEEVKKMAEDRSLLAQLGAGKIKKSLESAYDLEKLAISKGVVIEEPFQGKSAFDNLLHVLGPSEDFYFSLVSEFEKGGAGPSIVAKAKRLIAEAWHKDELIEPEPNATSPRNNTSVILLARLDKHFLFCGDAGVEAMHHATDYAAAGGYDIASGVHYHQVPHHGSKRNIGPSVLSKIIGPIQPLGYEGHKHAFISAAVNGDPKHPSKRVMNAFTRRGVRVIPATCGKDQCFRSDDVPVRAGWQSIAPVGFIDSYEEED